MACVEVGFEIPTDGFRPQHDLEPHLRRSVQLNVFSDGEIGFLCSCFAVHCVFQSIGAMLDYVRGLFSHRLYMVSYFSGVLDYLS